jgi:ABC-2 type transport system permease protein
MRGLAGIQSFVIHVFSFFMKEIHDVRRQPRLMLSLVGGPLLVLAVFGATFRSSIPKISVVLVWPEGGISGVDQAQVEKLVGRAFVLKDVVSNLEEAMHMLDTGQVDVVQVVPSGDQLQPGGSDRPQLQIYSRAIDPAFESWIRSLSYRERTYLNDLLLTQQVSAAQERAEEYRQFLLSAQKDLNQLDQVVTKDQEQTALEKIGRARLFLMGLFSILPPLEDQSHLAPEVIELYNSVSDLINDLNLLDQALRSGDLETQKQRLNQTLDEIDRVNNAIQRFRAMPAEDLSTPIIEKYTNLRGGAYSLVIYFAPSVLALLVQHLAITLAALAFVRERQMGSFEMFRVAPLNMIEIILGKTLAYTLYVSVAGGALAVLLRLLDVPAPSNPPVFAALLVLVAIASIGIGFLISSVSATDSQAIQLTMLALLLSIFFSGFFLPLSGFLSLSKIVTYLLPMTYAISGFQSLLLSGNNPPALVWIGLSGITIASFGLVVLMMRRVSRKVLS